jgi:hypothetical protein
LVRARSILKLTQTTATLTVKTSISTWKLLNKLEEDIKKDSLPKTEGFFYGDDSYTWKERDEMKQYDLQFVANARKAIIEGYDIVYSCWW